MACQVDIPNPEYPIGTRAHFVHAPHQHLERTHRDWWLEDSIRTMMIPGTPASSAYYCTHDWVMSWIGTGRIVTE